MKRGIKACRSPGMGTKPWRINKQTFAPSIFANNKKGKET
jgi:hypothetical protein